MVDNNEKFGISDVVDLWEGFVDVLSRRDPLPTPPSLEIVLPPTLARELPRDIGFGGRLL